jgi:hypothetical protein
MPTSSLGLAPRGGRPRYCRAWLVSAIAAGAPAPAASRPGAPHAVRPWRERHRLAALPRPPGSAQVAIAALLGVGIGISGRRQAAANNDDTATVEAIGRQYARD